MFADTPTLFKIKLSPKPAPSFGTQVSPQGTKIRTNTGESSSGAICPWRGLQLPRQQRSLSHVSELTAHGCPVRLHGTHVQRLQAVPAEGMLAVLTHHLCTALVPLDVHPALGAAFDGRVALFHLESGAVGETYYEGCTVGIEISSAARLF